MQSFVSWVDYSAKERDQMKQAVRLFKESETLDELGIGSIRDVVANTLFPGTSTIQTRLKYFLFVPWIYKELEAKGATSANVAAQARRRELALIQPLSSCADSDGAFGRRSGAAIQRLPSSVYWAGLCRWGIFERDATLENYHRSWDANARARAGTSRPDDEGIAASRNSLWHADLPLRTQGWDQSFALTRDEARFLQERVFVSCPKSLLAHAAENAPLPDATAPWNAFAELPELLRHHVAIAENFSLLMQGASCLYNVALTEHSQLALHVALRDAHRSSFQAWQTEARDAGVAHWDLDVLWNFAFERKSPIATRTQAFVRRWQELVRSGGVDLVDASAARALIRNRENELKTSRSRFANPRSLELWGGTSGKERLNFRWRTVRTLLSDLYAGLRGGN